jgi:outer membrane protein assembly factor BamA
VQQRDRLGRVFAAVPTLFGAPIRSSLVLQKRRQAFSDDNVSDTTSVSWEQRTTVGRRLVLAYAYRFDRVHTFETRAPDPNFPAFDITLKIARLTASAAWDSRDDPAAPTRGTLVTSSLESAPGGLGSEIRFVRVFSQARYFWSRKGTTFASAAQYGVVVPLGGQEVIPSERFYTGGSTSIRGLVEDGAGPRDFFGPVGGRVLLLFNQEARVPLTRWLQGVGFVDAGNVFQAPGETSLGGMTTAIGGGARFVTPFALIRVDYGRVVRGLPEGAARGRWMFAIGHAF